MAVPPWVSMYTNAGRLSSLAREPLRVSQIGNSCARRRRWRGGQRRADRVEGVRERGRDLVLAADTSAHASTSSLWACSHSWSSGVIP